VVNFIENSIGQLGDFRDMEHMLKELGLKHAKMGVMEEHYHVFSRAILNTLKAGLKNDYTPDVQNAWI
jgi:hemoglobin-like flavoprotein